jgi:hypothetical protein
VRGNTSIIDPSQNPFSDSDPNRREIWDILMRRDFEAFVAGNWFMVETDFWTEGFCGIDARKELNPDEWKVTFPNIESYRDEWLRQAREFALVRLDKITTLEFLYRSCRLEAIEIRSQLALAHKKFDGTTQTVGGNAMVLRFQTLYQMVRRGEHWKISGFVGFLPYPILNTASKPSANISASTAAMDPSTWKPSTQF